MTFKPIRRRRLYLEIAEQISDAISKGDYKPGERLPSERDLADLLGVSRASVREALSVLEAVGMIRVDVGNGTFVSQRLELQRFDFKGDMSPLDLMEARITFEQSLVELIIARCSARHLSRLELCIERSRDLLYSSDELDEFYEWGVQFHREYASLSGNDVLAQIGYSLVNPLQHPMWCILNRRAIASLEVRQRQIDEHQAIYVALQQRDVEKSKENVVRHLQRLQNQMLN